MNIGNVAKQVLPERTQNVLRFLNRKRRAFVTRPKFSFPNPPENSRTSSFAFFVSRNNLLNELGEKYQPSKRGHDYLIYYWMHFRDIRFDVKKVLEIGLQTDRSIRMWEEFFPNATIYGMDTDSKCKQFEGGGRKFLIGIQSDSDFW